MKRMFARVATLAATLPLAIAMAAGSAQAGDPVSANVPGCWGVGSNDTIVCDVVVTAHGAHTAFEVMYVKACAGECHNIPVTWVDPGLQTAQVCYTYKDGWGASHGGCVTDKVVAIDLTDLVVNLFDCNSNVCMYQ